MSLTWNQKLAQELGYGKTIPSALQNFDTDNPSLVDAIDEIIEKLAEVDAQLDAARSDSMALEVGDLKLNYSSHVSHLKQEGCRLLRRLEALTEVPLQFDRYRGITPKLNSNSISIVSYW